MPPRRSAIAWFVIAIAAAALFLRDLPLGDLASARPPMDFNVYVVAREHLLRGSDPYGFSINNGSIYKYSPAYLLLFLLLPVSAAYCWIAAKAAYLAAWAATLVLGADYRRPRALAFLGLGLLLAWRGTIETLANGQTEFLLLFGGVLAARWRRDRPMAAGAVAGLLPLVKLPWCLLFLPLAVEAWREGGARRAGRLVAGAGAAVLSWLVIVPWAWFGTERFVALNLAWVRVLREQPDSLFVTPWVQSLWANLGRWFGAHGPARLVASLVALPFVAWLFVRLSRRLAGAREGLAWAAPWALFIHWLSPLGWKWGGLFAVGIPWSAESAAWTRGRPWARAALLGAAGLGFLLQSSGTLQGLGAGDWAGAVRDQGGIMAYWVALLALSI